MITVIPNAEHLLDHLGDPKRRPELRVVTVRRGATQQGAQQAGLLAGREPSRASRCGTDLQSSFALPFVSLHPSHHRTGRAPESTRDIVQ